MSKYLQIEHLSVNFEQYKGALSKKNMNTVKDLSLSVNAGELICIVGESGSGKSVLAHAVLGILPYNAKIDGTIKYKGEVLDDKKKERLRGKEIVLVPQSTTYLDPKMKLGRQITKGASDKEKNKRLTEIFEHFHLKEEVKNQYPHQLSGGMTRRILVSTALIEKPSLVIADEPTKGLDMKLSKRVMSHFRELADLGAAVLVITHDLELAVQTSEKIVIFQKGVTVEQIESSNFNDYSKFKSDYSKELFKAMPVNW